MIFRDSKGYDFENGRLAGIKDILELRTRSTDPKIHGFLLTGDFVLTSPYEESVKFVLGGRSLSPLPARINPYSLQGEINQDDYEEFEGEEFSRAYLKPHIDRDLSKREFNLNPFWQVLVEPDYFKLEEFWKTTENTSGRKRNLGIYLPKTHGVICPISISSTEEGSRIDCFAPLVKGLAANILELEKENNIA